MKNLHLNEKQIENLEKLGFKRWSKGEEDRLYIKLKKLGFRVERYNTGNISSAYIGDELISNSKAKKILNSNPYIDLVEGVIVCPEILKERIENLIEESL